MNIHFNYYFCFNSNINYVEIAWKFVFFFLSLVHCKICSTSVGLWVILFLSIVIHMILQYFTKLRRIFVILDKLHNNCIDMYEFSWSIHSLASWKSSTKSIYWNKTMYWSPIKNPTRKSTTSKLISNKINIIRFLVIMAFGTSKFTFANYFCTWISRYVITLFANENRIPL